MGKKLTTQEFIDRAIKTHGDIYDYSEVDYKTNKDTVKIFCKVHSEFFHQMAGPHMRGHSCPKCSIIKRTEIRSKTQEQFITDCSTVHGNTYDYTETKYRGSNCRVKIKCNKHNSYFTQTANSHLSGRGCPQCGPVKSAEIQSKTREQFITECVAVHGDNYNYTDTEYKNNSSKVKIKCNKHSHSFTQTPNAHLSGQGCPICGAEKTGAANASNQERFLESTALVHGTSYIYDKTVYVRSNKKIIITCRVHGDYEMTPNDHLSGRGCRACAKTGYNPSKLGHLYLLQCGDVTKIGITNKTPNVRALEVSKSFGAEFLVKRSWEFEDGSIPDEIETTLLRELRKEYDRPVNKFDGSSECFLSVDHTILLSRINQEIELRMQ